MKTLVRNTKSIVACSLLILFVGYMASITLFYHTHVINGERIVHSHPYSQAPDTGKHSHTTLEFATIASLSVVLMLAASFGGVFSLFLTTALKRESLLYNFYYNIHLSVVNLRGPPTC